MSKKKPRRKSAETGNETQRHLTLGFALVRANALSEATIAARPYAPQDKAGDFRAMSEAVTTAQVGPWGKWFTFVSLYYATIQVLVEAIIRTKISNDAIHTLLANTEMRRRLREYRDVILHAGSATDPPLATFVSDLKGADEWCNVLRTECSKLVRAHFSKPQVKAIVDRLVASAQTR